MAMAGRSQRLPETWTSDPSGHLSCSNTPQKFWLLFSCRSQAPVQLGLLLQGMSFLRLRTRSQGKISQSKNLKGITCQRKTGTRCGRNTLGGVIGCSVHGGRPYFMFIRNCRAQKTEVGLTSGLVARRLSVIRCHHGI